MISDWEYDNGMPTYMSTINEYTDARRPCWKCKWFLLNNDTMDTNDMQVWLMHNCDDTEYTMTARFNSGYPFIAIEIYDKTVATAFKLVWDN